MKTRMIDGQVVVEGYDESTNPSNGWRCPDCGDTGAVPVAGPEEFERCRRCGAPDAALTHGDLCVRCDHLEGDLDYGTGEEDREDGASEVETEDDLADAEEEE